jgi:uncharacterized membrane protein
MGLQAERSTSKQKTTGWERETLRETTNPSRRSTSASARRSYSEHNGKPKNARRTQEEVWAYGLGLFGIGLGLAELMAPRRLARMIGAPPGHNGLIRLMGLREIAAGVGIFTQRSPTTGVWMRVAGDVADLACLGAAFLSSRSDRGKLTIATIAVAGATLADMLTAQQLSRGVTTRNGRIPVTAALIIDSDREELYRHWRDLTNLPKFMKHLVRIDVKDARRSHWVARGPVGSTIEWDAEVTEERPNELIAWRSIEGSELNHAGSVRFEQAPGDRGTVVTVNMHYQPLLGTIGAGVVAWFGEDPNQTIKMDLRRFKQMMETGEVVTTEGQPAGREESTSWKYDQATRR